MSSSSINPTEKAYFFMAGFIKSDMAREGAAVTSAKYRACLCFKYPLWLSKKAFTSVPFFLENEIMISFAWEFTINFFSNWSVKWEKGKVSLTFNTSAKSIADKHKNNNAVFIVYANPRLRIKFPAMIELRSLNWSAIWGS